MQRTKIEYLTHSWNPIAMRCTPISAGCAHCWHLAMAKRLAKNPLLDEGVRAAYAGGIPALDNKELEAPLHLRKPARIGVNWMGDLFHESIKFEMIKRVLANAANVKRHTYFFLTKRVERMKEVTRWFRQFSYRGEEGYTDIEIPYNFRLGVSVEDQKTKSRIDFLRTIPAKHRFISFEPLLEDMGEIDFTGISWAIVGGETGPHARPLHPDWVRSVRDQCQAAGVPVFFKSWGEFCVPSQIDTARMLSMYDGDRKRFDPRSKNPFRFGRGKTGCLLDGREWKEIP